MYNIYAYPFVIYSLNYKDGTCILLIIALQMTLWSMAKSPLMFGGDLRHIDQATFRLITNPTLLEINSYSDNNKEVINLLQLLPF